jgi:hypothetical protein
VYKLIKFVLFLFISIVNKFIKKVRVIIYASLDIAQKKNNSIKIFRRTKHIFLDCVYVIRK